jgi:hypothetical protein
LPRAELLARADSISESMRQQSPEQKMPPLRGPNGGNRGDVGIG